MLDSLLRHLRIVLTCTVGLLALPLTGHAQVGTADPAEFAGFTALARGLAQALAANGPASRLETGASKRWTAVVMSLLCGLVSAFATIARFAHASDASPNQGCSRATLYSSQTRASARVPGNKATIAF